MLLNGDVGRLEEVDSLDVADDLMIFRAGKLYRINTNALDNFVSALKTTTVTTTPYTATDEDLLLVDPDTLGADITINLPLSADRFSDPYSRPVLIKHSGTTATYNVIVIASGAEEIDGMASINFTSPQSKGVHPDGADWWIA